MNEPKIEITDIYDKLGNHQGSVARTLSGKVLWVEPRTPCKDVQFIPRLENSNV